uniref:Uncharacterized protein n=1 Tax=Oryza sativa subsp. japonica TaxID=39947 RepID=Q6YTR1_ORYSJ|nr:hypothetical protein [Oryza sativa Japonica Group]BAD03905.1 hypothetical protein [Oryza sativa Japonica Group]
MQSLTPEHLVSSSIVGSRLVLESSCGLRNKRCAVGVRRREETTTARSVERDADLDAFMRARRLVLSSWGGRRRRPPHVPSIREIEAVAGPWFNGAVSRATPGGRRRGKRGRRRGACRGEEEREQGLEEAEEEGRRRAGRVRAEGGDERRDIRLIFRVGEGGGAREKVVGVLDKDEAVRYFACART